MAFSKSNGLSSKFKSKSMALAIEHLPCCALSFAAGFIGLPILNHNPAIELGFAMGGAVTGEYLGSKIFHGHKHMCGLKNNVKRYGVSLVFGLASWGIHQQLFHDHTHTEEKVTSSAYHGTQRSEKHNHHNH